MSVFDWASNCEPDLAAALASILNPLTAGTLQLNPDRGDPEIEQVPLQLSVEIYHDGEWYEQRLYIQPRSVRGKEVAGFEFSKFQYVLQDFYHPCRTTFVEGAVSGQRIRVRNAGKNRWLFKGFVESVKPVAFHVKSNGADMRRLQVACINEIGLFRRGLIAEIVNGPTTEGAMLKDLTERYVPELDASGINPNVGQPIAKKTLDHPHLFQVYQEVLRGNPDLAFFLDISCEPSKIYLDKKSAGSILIPAELTDSNIYNFCRPGDHWLNTTAKTRRNKITLRGPRLYNQGSVEVELGTKIIYGTGTDWAEKVFAGNRIRLVGSPHTYTVEKVNAAPSGTPPEEDFQDLYITGEMQDETGEGLSYEIIGDERDIVAEDTDDITRQRLISGGQGPHAGVNEVLIIESTPLTDDEAQRLADIALRSDAIEGEFNTNSRLFNPPKLRAGASLRHNMPQRSIQEDIPIQEIDWDVMDGYAPGPADEAPLRYKISFTDRGLMTENIFLQLLLAQRRARIRDQARLTSNKTLNERSVMLDCLRATEGILLDERSEITDSLAADTGIEVDEASEMTEAPLLLGDISDIEGPWYLAPLDDGQQGFVPLDLDDPDTYSYPT